MGRVQSALPLVIVIGLLVGAPLVPLATTGSAAQQTQPDTDNTVTRIDVRSDGSAVWTIRIRTRLDTDEDVEEYEAFQSRFRNNTADYLDPFRERMQRVVARAANATGREMRAEDFSADTTIQEVPRRWGVVTFRFTWTNFTARTDEQLVIGDVFQGGFYLAENDSLVIAAPDGYDFTAVEPRPAEQGEGTVTWFGREDFADGRPRVELRRTAADASSQSPETSPGLSVPTIIGNRALWIVAVMVVAGLIAYGVHRWRRRGDKRTEHVVSQGTLTGEPSDGPVMTDEERVSELIDDRGGRLRQTEIADELDWSPSKTSRVISDMVDAGTVEKLQLGRENLIELAEDD